MPTSAEETTSPSQHRLREIRAALEDGALQPVRRMLNGLRPVEIAHLLESSPPKTRLVLWNLVDAEHEGEVLQELLEEARADILKLMDSAQLAAVTESLEDDDVTDILQQLPDRVIQQILAAMSEQHRARVASLLTYHGETAGGLMNSDVITVRPNLTLDVVLRYLRRQDELPPSTDILVVTNRDGVYLGILPLHKLLTSDPHVTVSDVMSTHMEAVPVNLTDTEVARLFERYDWVSCPVVDEQGKVLGRITIDDVVDVIREDAEHSLMSMAGVEMEKETFAPVLKSAPRRAIWLGLHLLAAVAASLVINLFQDTLDKVVTLAILMPIVASMGGVAGSQTLTVIIRGIALGHVDRNNIRWLLSREFLVSAINGLLWALVIGVVVSLWKQDFAIAVIIAAAMIINLLAAALAGTLIPVALKVLKIDPAVAGSVILIAITDVIGFLSFLGLAAYFYA